MEAGRRAVLDDGLRRAVVIAAGAASVFVTLIVVLWPVDHATSLDQSVAAWMAANRGGVVVSAATIASMCGSVVVIAPAALAIAYLLHRRRGWHHARWYVLAVTGATAMYLALSYAFGRARPPMGERLIEDDRWSFPSGHSTQAIVFCFATAMIVAEGRPPRVRTACFALALACALAISGSRIVLDAHWTTDVCGGFALGACWLATVTAWRAARGRWNSCQPPSIRDPNKIRRLTGDGGTSVHLRNSSP